MPSSDVPLSRALAGAAATAPPRWNGAELHFLQKLLAVGAMGGVAVVLVLLADVLLLAFGAVLVAVLLHAISDPLVRHTGLGRPASLTIAVCALAGVTAAVMWLFGQEAAVQLAALGELIPQAWRQIEFSLSASPPGAYLLAELKQLDPLDGLLVTVGPRLVRDTAAGAAAATIVFFAGLYLAFHPNTYLGGLIRLAPQGARTRAAAVLASCGQALNRWLLGQLVSMLLVGATTGVGLWLAGVPSPLALGVVAGLGQFIPVVGPAVAMLPGLLVAAAEGPETLLWASVVYVAAMQLEANVITPLMLRQMVELPMAVTLFAVLAMGVLLGPLGVLFATPLAVVAHVLVRMVYVEGILGDARQAPAP